MNNDNVIHVPPRRRRIVYKGMHGWVEYHPGTRTWSYTLKMQFINSLSGDERTEADAVLTLKCAIDILLKGGSTGIRSVD